jgi:hypothetical protein
MRFLLLLTLAFGQQEVTDKNFYGAIYKGMHLVRFTVPETVRKLRLRNFPSVVLFRNGKKVKVWKANFDGELDLKTDDVKESIDWYAK